jgi:hypothetical protein
MRSLLCFLFASAVSSCSTNDDAGGTPITPDSGTEAAADAGSQTLICQPGDLSDVTEVVPSYLSGDPPTPAAGGTPTAGRYVMISSTFYYGDASVPANQNVRYRSTIEISGNEARNTSDSTVAGGTPFYGLGTFVVTGSEIAYTRRCSSLAASVGQTARETFTASATGLTTYTTQASSLLVREFTRR